MPVTPVLSLPYPAAADTADVPRDIQALATKLDTFGTTGTTLPTTPTDGQEFFYLASATNGTVWHLRYRAAATGAYKWEFAGGSPLVVKINTDESFTADGSMHDCATVGPDVALPLNGDYLYESRAEMYTTASGNVQMGTGIGVAGVALPGAPDWCFMTTTAVPNLPVNTTFTGKMTAQIAGRALRMQYQAGVGGAAAHVRYRILTVTPIRVG